MGHGGNCSSLPPAQPDFCRNRKFSDSFNNSIQKTLNNSCPLTPQIYEPTYGPARRSRQSHGWGHAGRHSTTTWTYFYPILTPTPLKLYKNGHFTYYLPFVVWPCVDFPLTSTPSSCPCSYLMTLWLFMRGLWGTRPLSTMRSKPISNRNSICRHILFQ